MQNRIPILAALMFLSAALLCSQENIEQQGISKPEDFYGKYLTSLEPIWHDQSINLYRQFSPTTDGKLLTNPKFWVDLLLSESNISWSVYTAKYMSVSFITHDLAVISNYSYSTNIPRGQFYRGSKYYDRTSYIADVFVYFFRKDSDKSDAIYYRNGFALPNNGIYAKTNTEVGYGIMQCEFYKSAEVAPAVIKQIRWTMVWAESFEDCVVINSGRKQPPRGWPDSIILYYNNFKGDNAINTYPNK